jgi:hypothetical protein
MLLLVHLKHKVKQMAKTRHRRIRDICEDIILKYMVREQLQTHSLYKQMWYWRNRWLWDTDFSNGEYLATLPQSLTQLWRVIKWSGYPGVSKQTVKKCLDRMVETGILYEYPNDVGRRHNEKPYFYPLSSMP